LFFSAAVCAAAREQFKALCGNVLAGLQVLPALLLLPSVLCHLRAQRLFSSERRQQWQLPNSLFVLERCVRSAELVCAALALLASRLL